MTKPDLLLVEKMLPEVEHALEARFNVHRWAPGSPDLEALPHIRAVATGGGTGLAAEMMARMPALEIIAINGIGTDAVDLVAARARGIVVTTTPGVLTDDVADMAFALILTAMRGILPADRLVRDGDWGRVALPLADTVSERRLGIFGLGHIGRAIARRAEGFAMEIAYSGRAAQTDVAYRFEPSLNALAAWADILVVATSGGPATRNLVDAKVIAALGEKGWLINVARGSVVDENALVQALTERRIAGAGLDVFVDEPHVPPALFALDNVVLQPHRASATRQTRQRMGDLIVDNLAAHFDGKSLPTPLW